MNRVQENPAIDGPDYVALVIEWDDDEDVTFVGQDGKLDGTSDGTFDGTFDNGPDAPADFEPRRTPALARTIATVVGALGVLALVSWGWHRVTAA